MKVLLLGAWGNLGSQLAEVFADQELIAWDQNDIDLTDSINTRQAIWELAPEVIINAVAYNAVDKCETDQAELEKAYQLNRQVVAGLAQLALDLGAIFIHYSTDYVFDGQESRGYREADSPNPVNKYGQSKRAGEQEILKFGPRLKFYLIRTSKLFGPRGQSPHCKQSFFDLMLALAEQQAELTVVDEEVSCFTYTKDLARATRWLLDNQLEFGIYHLTNYGVATWYQAAKELFDISKKIVKVKAVSGKDFPRPAPRPKYSVLLNTKTKPLRSWQEALKDYLRNHNGR